MKILVKPPQLLFKEFVTLTTVLLFFGSASITALAAETSNTALTAPTIASLAPAHNATNVSIDANLVATFSENVFAMAGGVVAIKTISGGITLESFTLPHASVVVSGTTVTINPSVNFNHITEYYVSFTNAFEDIDGNDFVGPVLWYFETRVDDYAAPTLTSTSPSNAATDFASIGWPVATFNESVLAIAGKTIHILRKADDTVVETFTLPTSTVVVSSSQVTIKPTAALQSSTEYYITIEAGAFTDASTNEFVGISNNTTWHFKTSPALVSLAPVNGAPSADPSGNLVATFSENVSLGSGIIFINNFSNATTVESITLPDARVTVSGASITINPTATLPLNVLLYVVIQHGVLKDADGDDIGQIGGSTNWAFNAQEPVVTLPIVSSFSPAHNATNVSINVSPVITFNENVGSVSGAAVNIKRYSDDTVIKSIGLINASPTTNTFSLGDVSGGLLYSTKYYVTVSGNAFKNAGGGGFIGILDKDTWSFTTEADPGGETVPPTITNYLPTVNATTVDYNTPLQLMFSEHVEPVAGKEINIYRYADDVFVKKFVLSTASPNNSYVITSELEPALEGNTQYYVLIDAGAFKDTWNNVFAGITNKDTWKFTTKPIDVTPPVVVSTTPVDGAVDVAVDIAEIIIDFNEAIYEGTSTDITITGFGTLEFGAVANRNGTDLHITPPSALQAGTTITVTLAVGLLQDNEGNATEEFSFSFTTAAGPDVAAPIINSLSPENEATDASVTTNLVATFNENIVAGAGTIAIRLASDNALVMSAVITSDMISGNVLTFNPFDLDAGVAYYVTLSAGAVQDAAGNLFAGFINNTTWHFTTTAPDVVAPTVVSFSPANNAIDVSLNTSLVITFDEPVQLAPGGSSKVAVIRTIEEDFAELILLEDANVTTISGNTVTMVFTGLEYGHTYYIKIESGVLADASGNVFTGFTANNVWRFSTEAAPDTEAPIVVSVSPEDNAIGVSATTDVVITFSEPVIASAGNITVRKLSDNSVQSSTAIASAVIAGNTVTVEDVLLEAGTEYYVDVSAELVRDAAGNYSAGLNGNPNWTFTTAAADVQAPQVVSFYPANNGQAVPFFSNLSITFNEDIQLTGNQGTIRFYRASDNGLLSSLEFSPLNGNVSISGPTLMFESAGTVLPCGTSIYAELSAGVLEDASGNDFEGLAGNTAWTFTTETSEEGRTVYTSFEPADNATNISSSLTQLRLTVIENVTASSSPSAKFILYKKATFEVVKQWLTETEVTIEGNVVILGNVPALENETEYAIEQRGANQTLACGAALGYGGLLGSNGRKLVAWNDDLDFWSFTTEAAPDTAPPSIVSVSPAATTTAVSTSTQLQLVFNEPIQKGTGTLQIQQYTSQEIITSWNVGTDSEAQVSGNTLTLSLKQALPANTRMYVTVFEGIVKDLAGNDYLRETIIDEKNWEFTTAPADTEAPQVVSFSPANNATNVALDASLAVTFNEPVKLALGGATKAFIIRTMEDDVSELVMINSSNISGNAVTVTFPQLAYGRTYYLTLNTDVLADLSNNVFTGFSATDSWRFTTEAAPKQDQTISFGTLDTKTFGAAAFDVEATASSGLAVAFSSSNELVATVSGKTITIVGAGTTNIIATQGGDEAYNAASPVVRELVVNKADQTIVFESLPAVGTSASPFALSAQASSGLPVSFASFNASVATISGTTITVVGAGSTTITATQAGNANYNAAVAVERTLVVNAEVASIALSGTLAFAEVLLNESVAKTLTITNEGNAPLTITNIVVPTGYATSVTSTSVNAGSSTAITITFTPIEARVYSGNVVITSNAASGVSQQEVSGEGVTITALPETSSAHWKVYPNPGTGRFLLRGIQTETVVITNASGRKHIRALSLMEANLYELDITDMPDGIYYVKVEEKGKSSVKRIIKIN